MKKTILIGGKAGQGVNQTSFVFAKALTKLGYYVFVYRDYPSLIRGGHNFNVISISNKPIYSFETQYDLIIALDQKTISLHLKELKKDGLVLGDKSIKSPHKISVDLTKITSSLGLAKIVGNDVLAGLVFGLFNLPIEPLFLALKDISKNNIFKVKKAIQVGYKLGLDNQKEKLPVLRNKAKYFLNAGQATASGALASGLDMYIAYPMTPATSVLHFLAKKKKRKKFQFCNWKTKSL